MHRCTQLSFSPRTEAKESWLTVYYGYQGALVFRQGQTITLCSDRIFLRGQFETQPWCCACVCVCIFLFFFPAGDPVRSQSLDMCRWTQNCSINPNSWCSRVEKAGVQNVSHKYKHPFIANFSNCLNNIKLNNKHMCYELYAHSEHSPFNNSLNDLNTVTYRI